MSEPGWGFNRLLGQDTASRALQGALKENRLSHALLFSGPPGSGKSTMAFLLAQAINCANRDAAPCEECRPCSKVAAGTHQDVVRVEPEKKSLKIDQLREVKKRFAYHTYETGSRVCILEDADKLTDAAAASLLKIMEEPSANLVFILTSSYPSQLPNTILSRCQRYVMQRLKDEQMTILLRQAKPEATSEEIAMAVNLGEGIPGRARDVLLNEEWEERRQTVYAAGEKMISTLVPEKDLLEEGQNWAQRTDLPDLLELLSVYFKDGLMWKICGDPMAMVDQGQKDFWQARQLTELELQKCLEIVNNSRRKLLSNINSTLALETLFLQIRGRMH